MKKFHRWMMLTLLLAIPVGLYLVVAEQASWRPRILGHHQGAVFLSAFAADGKTIATADSNSVIKLWDVQTYHNLKTFGFFKMVGENLIAMAFSPDGKTLITAGISQGDARLEQWELNIRRLDISTGKFQKTKFQNYPQGLSAAFSPDGKLVAIETAKHLYRSQGTIKLCDLQTGKELRAFVVPQSPDDLAFSRDSQTLAVVVGSFDPEQRKTQLWDTHRIKLKQTIRNGAISVAFSPDERILATVSVVHQGVDYQITEIVLWNMQTKKCTRTFGGKDYSDHLTTADFSPDGRTLVTGSYEHQVELWRVK